MKTYKVEYSPAAKNDLKAIYSYIAFRLKEKSTAQTIVNRIRKQIRELHYAPERYALVDREPWISMGMRKLPVRNYIVFYYLKQDNSIVMINRIVYGGRSIQDIIEQD